MQLSRVVGWIGIALALGCGRQSGRTERDASVATSASTSASPSASAVALPAPEPHAQTGVEPTTLLTLPTSAYSPWLTVDEGVVYLLTDQAAHRLVPGQEAPSIPLDLGIGPAVTESSFIYWSKGAIWRASKKGGKARRVAALSHQPQRFVTSGEQFVWLDRTDEGKFTIQTLDAGKPRTIVSPTGDIDTLTMLQDWVFFVERATPSSWRFGGVRLAGGAPTFSTPRSGRTPAMLVAAGDLYYYDSNTLEIHRLSPDFLTEETISRDFICSPIAVSAQIYCAHMAGLFELSRKPSSSPVRLTGSRQITAVAASSTLVAWLRDTGPDRLALEMLPVLMPDGGTPPQPQ
jgi:hypothetical protein